MTTPSRPFALTDAILFTGDTFVEKQALLVADRKIVDLTPNDKVPEGFQPISCANHILSAGFIDCQVNGGGNVLLNTTPTVEGVLAIAAAHRKSGTTRLLPTCITDKPEVIASAIEATRQARKIDTSVLGIHLEGPHISEARKGTHNPAFIRPMTANDLQTYKPEQGEIIVVTVATENTTPEQIKALVAQGTLVSLGHSAATPEQARASFAAGASCVTHLFNGMDPLASRNGGLAGVALDDKRVFASILIDNAHVAPEMVRLAVRGKAGDNLFMVCDSMPPAGADVPLPFDLCGIKVFPKGNACINEFGVFAGALLTLGECVAVAIRDVRLDPEKVLRMASTIPAEFLGLGDRFGKLLPTYTADIVMLDHRFKAQRVWRDGIAL